MTGNSEMYSAHEELQEPKEEKHLKQEEEEEAGTSCSEEPLVSDEEEYHEEGYEEEEIETSTSDEEEEGKEEANTGYGGYESTYEADSESEMERTPAPPSSLAPAQDVSVAREVPSGMLSFAPPYSLAPAQDVSVAREVPSGMLSMVWNKGITLIESLIIGFVLVMFALMVLDPFLPVIAED